MEKKILRELSTDDLIKKRKTTLFVTGLLAGAIIASFILSIFLSIKKGKIEISQLLSPFALTPILFIIFSNIKKIDEELKSRNSNS